MMPAPDPRPLAPKPTLAWAIALSLTVHLILLLLLPRASIRRADVLPLQVRLAPAPPESRASKPSQSSSSVPERHVPHRSGTVPAKTATAATATARAEPAATPEVAVRPTIDVAAALASARSIAKQARPQTTLVPPKTPLTVETAVAKATRPDIVVESRGADGEWITQDRKSRCVGRIQRKWFEEGVPMLTLCEVRKG